MSKINYLDQLQWEVDGIRKELACTEDEAFFVIRRIMERKIAVDENFSQHPEARMVAGKERKPSEEEYRQHRTEAIETAKRCLEYLEGIRSAIDKGRWDYYLTAVAFCHHWAFPIPSCVSEKLDRAVADYLHDKVATLDEAFGAKRPRYYRQDKIRPFSQKGDEIYFRCLELQKQGSKIAAPEYGGGLFLQVGEEFSVSASTVRDIYYSHTKARKFTPTLIKPNISNTKTPKGTSAKRAKKD